MKQTLNMALFFGLSVLSACLFGEKKQDDDGGGLPNLSWPERMEKSLTESDYAEAYGLFSSSGWSNVGQVMIYTKHAKHLPKVEYVANNGKKVAGSYTLTQEQWQNLQPVLEKSTQLQNVDSKAFDGIQYDFRHVKKNANKKIQLLHKIQMNNPDLITPKPEAHLQLIKNLYALRNLNRKNTSSAKKK